MSFKVAPLIFVIVVGFFVKISIDGTVNSKTIIEQAGRPTIPTSEELRGSLAAK